MIIGVQAICIKKVRYKNKWVYDLEYQYDHLKDECGLHYFASEKEAKKFAKKFKEKYGTEKNKKKKTTIKIKFIKNISEKYTITKAMDSLPGPLLKQYLEENELINIK